MQTASRARSCKHVSIKKAKQQTKFVVWKALGKAKHVRMTMSSIGNPEVFS